MQLIRVEDEDGVQEPTEIIDATYADVRVCVFLDVIDGEEDTWSFEAQRRESGRLASIRYHETWKAIDLRSMGIEPSYAARIGDMSEAVTRAALVLARLIEQHFNGGDASV